MNIRLHKFMKHVRELAKILGYVHLNRIKFGCCIDFGQLNVFTQRIFIAKASLSTILSDCMAVG